MSERFDPPDDLPTDPDGEIDLGISRAAVATIIDAARAAGEIQEEAGNEPIQDPETPDDVDPDAMSRQVRDLIGDLNVDEQASLIALTWIGRGDYLASEWEEVRRLARERNADGSAPEYLADTELLGDLLSEGLAALGAPAEEEER